MNAVVCHGYGSFDVLKVEGINKRSVPDEGVPFPKLARANCCPHPRGQPFVVGGHRGVLKT